jgi:hypothetical protein
MRGPSEYWRVLLKIGTNAVLNKDGNSLTAYSAPISHFSLGSKPLEVDNKVSRLRHLMRSALVQPMQELQKCFNAFLSSIHVDFVSRSFNNRDMSIRDERAHFDLIIQRGDRAA